MLCYYFLCVIVFLLLSNFVLFSLRTHSLHTQRVSMCIRLSILKTQATQTNSLTNNLNGISSRLYSYAVVDKLKHSPAYGYNTTDCLWCAHVPRSNDMVFFLYIMYVIVRENAINHHRYSFPGLLTHKLTPLQPANKSYLYFDYPINRHLGTRLVQWRRNRSAHIFLASRTQ